MNRRQLLKYLLAAPAVAAVPAVLAACIRSPLSEESLEELLKQIADWADGHGKPIAIHPTHAWWQGHIWRPDADICINCRVTALDVEEGLATKFCHGSSDEEPLLFGFGEP